MATEHMTAEHTTAQHFLPGKDASLEASIAHMQARLSALGFHVEERSWLNPLGDIWSVHLRDRDCPLLFTNGKGSSRPAALASALGEFCERLACNYFWSHYYLGERYAGAAFSHHPQERWFPLPGNGVWPEEVLTDELRDFYDPEGSIDAASLVDRNTGNAERGICALPFTRLNDGKTVWFPVNILGNLYVSNGMAAGNSLPEARAQALSEIVERHVKFRVFGEGLCLPEVPTAVLARFPKLAAGVATLRAAGFGILVRDASLGGQYPVLCVTLLNPRDQGCYCSFGAHPRFEVALERALTELLQGRALDALDGFPEPGFDLDEISSAPNLEIHFVDSSGIVGWPFLGDAPDFDFCDWNFAATTDEDYAWLVRLIEAQGFDIYAADYTHLGVYACRILVPGMSEIYPVDDLEYENNSVANTFRDAILDFYRLGGSAGGDLLATLNELGLADERPVAALIGLAPDAGSLWEDLRLGELKTLLALIIGDEAAIREGCDWIRHFAQIDGKRRAVYRCIETLLDLRAAGLDKSCRQALASLYPAETLQQAKALLAALSTGSAEKKRKTGQKAEPKANARVSTLAQFCGLSASSTSNASGTEPDVLPETAPAGSLMHQRLLEAYDKVRRAHTTPGSH